MRVVMKILSHILLLFAPILIHTCRWRPSLIRPRLGEMVQKWYLIYSVWNKLHKQLQHVWKVTLLCAKTKMCFLRAQTFDSLVGLLIGTTMYGSSHTTTIRNRPTAIGWLLISMVIYRSAQTCPFCRPMGYFAPSFERWWSSDFSWWRSSMLLHRCSSKR
jgi:hypothetical protein